MGEVKYDKAYDSKNKVWVTAKQFNEDNKADWYDKPRYFSSEDVNDGSCEILTYVRESVPFRRKNMKDTTPDIVVTPHFTSIGKYTTERARDLVRVQEHLESEVHRTAKEIASKLKFIKIPAIILEIWGWKLQLAPTQYVPVKFVETEKYCGDSYTRPDVLMKMELLDVTEDLHIEILYSHRVDMIKKSRLENIGTSCLEIDLSDLKVNRDMTKAELKKIITERIEKCGYWISNKLERYCAKRIREYVLELSTATAFYISNTHSKYDYDKRVYAWKDKLDVPSDHPCYLSAENSNRGDMNRAVEPIMCKNCDHCLMARGYSNDNVDKLLILCDRLGEFVEMSKEQKIKVMAVLKKKLLDDYTEAFKLNIIKP